MDADEMTDTLRKLWRHGNPADPEARPGPRQRLSLDVIVSTAVALADEGGPRRSVEEVSMRSLASRLGVGAMSLYTYVRSREQLVELMVDHTYGQTSLPRHPSVVRARLEAVAMVVYEEHLQHPWLGAAAGVRPGLGPNAIARYQWQLEAVEPLDLDDVEMDQAVALLGGFAMTAARLAHDTRAAGAGGGEPEREQAQAWWAVVGPVLATLTTEADAPLAHRVGTAAAAAYGGPRSAEQEYRFGLACIVDGLLQRRSAGPECRPPSAG